MFQLQGYFRKGEVEFSTYHFLDAYKSYERALELQPDDDVILQAMAKANRERQKDMKGVVGYRFITKRKCYWFQQCFCLLFYLFYYTCNSS